MNIGNRRKRVYLRIILTKETIGRGILLTIHGLKQVEILLTSLDSIKELFGGYLGTAYVRQISDLPIWIN